MLVCIFVPVFVYGQSGINTAPSSISTSPDSQKITIKNPFNCGGSGSGGNCTLIDFIKIVLQNVIMPLAAVVAVMYIIWAGFLYVTAQGNPKNIEVAHQNLLYALIGTGILLGAAGISAVVSNTVTSLITP